MKDTKSYIYRVLDRLADNAQSNDGQLQFQRFDLNRVVTQVNIRMRGSRVRLGLLIFRIPRMIARAEAHRWSAADFEKVAPRDSDFQRLVGAQGMGRCYRKARLR